MVLGPKALLTSERIYKVFESTHLNKLKENKGNVFEKGVKVIRSRRLAE